MNEIGSLLYLLSHILGVHCEVYTGHVFKDIFVFKNWVGMCSKGFAIFKSSGPLVVHIIFAACSMVCHSVLCNRLSIQPYVLYNSYIE